MRESGVRILFAHQTPTVQERPETSTKLEKNTVNQGSASHRRCSAALNGRLGAMGFVVFRESDRGKWLTGVNYRVDGRITAR
jgi:hypothetical protein